MWPPDSSVLLQLKPVAENQLARLNDPSAVYFGEFPFEVTAFQAYNLKYLVSTPFSPHEENGRPRHSQKLGYKLDSNLVCFPFNRRSVETQHQLSGAISREFIFLRIWNDANHELRGGRHWRSPNSAEPIRTIVAPSSMAISKSWLMPMDSSARSKRVARSRSFRKNGLTSSAFSRNGGMAINPRNSRFGSPLMAATSSGSCRSSTPDFVGSSCSLTS